MTYVIRWSKSAERPLARLPHQLAHRIVQKVDSVKDHPFHFLEHFEGADYFKLRIGDDRLLVDVDFQDMVIYVRILGHRRNIYQR